MKHTYQKNHPLSHLQLLTDRNWIDIPARKGQFSNLKKNMDSREQIIKQINTFYKIISGKKSDARVWREFKYLFFENATFYSYPKFADKSSSKLQGVDEYINRLKDFLEKEDFYEMGIKYKVMTYGNICSVYNEYIAFEDPEKEIIKNEGINLIHLLFDGTDWKIVNMLWEDK